MFKEVVMVSRKNKTITIKVSRDAFDFITTLSKKYGVSISSFCQDCITQSILLHDKKSREVNVSSPDVYYKQLAFFINETYDDRRKKC